MSFVLWMLCCTEMCKITTECTFKVLFRDFSCSCDGRLAVKQPCAEVWGCGHADVSKEMAFQWSTCSGHSGWGSLPISLSQPGKAPWLSRGEELREGSRRRLKSPVMLLPRVRNHSQIWKDTSPATSSREAGLSVCIEWGEPN